MTVRRDFIIIANAWSAGRDNPTSKHRIALELARRGHRILWVEGSGMRTPSMGSGPDRLRMVRKVVAAFRGVRREEVGRAETLTPALSPEGGVRGLPSSPFRGEDRGEGHSLRVLSPLFIPLPRHELVRKLNGLICRWSVLFWGWRLGFRDPVLINYVPVLAEAMRRRSRASQTADYRPQTAEGGVKTIGHVSSPPESAVCSLRSLVSPRVVYHCVDRWDKFGTYDSAMMAEMDRRCCVYADLVIASSTELYDRCLHLNQNTVMIPHGVDWEHFREAVRLAPCASRLPLAPPIIGFFGLLSEWVDQQLILQLARKMPEASIVLIGKADVDVTRLRGVPNIHLLGPKPFAELPAQIAGFTVGIIPFVVNELTRAVNPIKLREMLAAGCPVVSTALPEVQKFSRVGGGRTEGHAVFVAHDRDEFVAMVANCLAHPLSVEERRALSDSMAGETWAGKVDEILRLVAGPHPNPPPRGAGTGRNGGDLLALPFIADN